MKTGTSLRGRSFLAGSLALFAVLCTGCDTEAPPAASPAPPPAPSVTASDWPEPDGSKVPGVSGTAAQYLADPRFAAADLARGELLSLACAACHTFHAGQETIIGPNLHGVFGRPAASVPGFDYSPALRGSGIVWTPETLESWLADPATFVAGTKMTFAGYRSADDRRDLIAWLLHATEQ